MKKVTIDKRALDNYLGCFGQFRIEDPVYRNLCALSLRCSIEQEQNNRLELLEDLVASDNMFIKIQ